MGGWVDGWMGGWVDGWIVRQAQEQGGWVGDENLRSSAFRWEGGWVEGWMGRRVDGWMGVALSWSKGGWVLR
jgi:hypothetical protein